MTEAEQNLQRAIGRIEGKLDAVHEDVQQLREVHLSLERRVRHSEVQAAKYGVVGGTAIVVAIEMIKAKIGLGGGA